MNPRKRTPQERLTVYATAAIAGIVVCLASRAMGMQETVAFGVGFVTVVALRVFAIRRGVHLPVFRVR